MLWRVGYVVVKNIVILVGGAFSLDMSRLRYTFLVHKNVIIFLSNVFWGAQKNHLAVRK